MILWLLHVKPILLFILLPPPSQYKKARAILGASRCLSGKESTCQCRKRGFSLWVQKIPQRRKWQPTAEFLSGKYHGQGSLADFHVTVHGVTELYMT